MAERVGGEEEEEEEEEEEAASPSRGDYLHALHQAASGGRSQKGVLSFKATPSFADSKSTSPHLLYTQTAFTQHNHHSWH